MKRLVAFALFFFSFIAWGEEKVIHLYNWADYMSDEVLEQFKKETGITVKQDYFASNEELIAKLQVGAFEYDVIVPSDYYIKLLIAQDLVRPLDLALLPNRKHLEERFQNPPYDPNNAHSVPYFWGTVGIGYNSEKVKVPINSWSALFDPTWKRKINLLDDMREVIGAALRLQGDSINMTDHERIEKTKKALLDQKRIVRTYNSGTYREILGAGDVWLTQAFSGDIGQLHHEQPNIHFVIPKEGGSIFTDNLAIPKACKHPNEAHQFINFILRPEIAAKLASKVFFATPNKDGWALLPEEIRNDRSMYPPPEVISKLEYVEDVGPVLKTYESLWIDLKTE